MKISEMSADQNSHERGVDTRRLYHFEIKYFRGTDASKVLPMKTLRRLASRIWKKYGKNKPLPWIAAGKGTYYGKLWLSYSQGDYIQLSRNQRNFLVLIHELIHSMGYDDHDKRFIKIYLKLLEEYLNLDHKELHDAAKEFKLINSSLPKETQ